MLPANCVIVDNDGSAVMHYAIEHPDDLGWPQRVLRHKTFDKLAVFAGTDEPVLLYPHGLDCLPAENEEITVPVYKAGRVTFAGIEEWREELAAVMFENSEAANTFTKHHVSASAEAYKNSTVLKEQVIEGMGQRVDWLWANSDAMNEKSAAGAVRMLEHTCHALQTADIVLWQPELMDEALGLLPPPGAPPYACNGGYDNLPPNAAEQIGQPFDVSFTSLFTGPQLHVLSHLLPGSINDSSVGSKSIWRNDMPVAEIGMLIMPTTPMDEPQNTAEREVQEEIKRRHEAGGYPGTMTVEVNMLGDEENDSAVRPESLGLFVAFVSLPHACVDTDVNRCMQPQRYVTGAPAQLMPRLHIFPPIYFGKVPEYGVHIYGFVAAMLKFLASPRIAMERTLPPPTNAARPHDSTPHSGPRTYLLRKVLPPEQPEQPEGLAPIAPAEPAAEVQPHERQPREEAVYVKPHYRTYWTGPGRTIPIKVEIALHKTPADKPLKAGQEVKKERILNGQEPDHRRIKVVR